MAIHGFIVVSILLSCLAANCYGEVHFSSLKDHNNFLVQTSNINGSQVLKAGENDIALTWSINANVTAGTSSAYKKVKAKLCFAPISQQDRAWRKTEDSIKKDKTCQFNIFEGEYKASNNITYTVERDIPSGTYFVRIYVYDSNNAEVAYGQSTDDKKAENLFKIQAISGRHATLDICSVVFSTFSIVSLFGFFYLEKRQAKQK
ncbi:transporter [Lithospermum erythrorhizon]|uniref:High-affinity nitrate transporter n=1 Tax=Lithospermum erythrorhizon TaxID=34254 RepID=A0AAV3QUR0_LITER